MQIYKKCILGLTTTLCLCITHQSFCSMKEEKLTVKDLIPQFEDIKSAQINIKKIIHKAKSDEDVFDEDFYTINLAIINAETIVKDNKKRLHLGIQDNLEELLKYLFKAYNNETHIAQYIKMIYKAENDYKNKKKKPSIINVAKKMIEQMEEFYKIANAKIKEAKKIYEKNIKKRKYLTKNRSIELTSEDKFNIEEALTQTEKTIDKLYNKLKERLQKISNKNK